MMAEVLEVSRRQYQRIEKLGFRNLNKKHTNKIIDHFSIKLSLTSGTSISCPQDDPEEFLPSRYCSDQYTSGDLANKYIDFYIKTFGEDEFNRFCKNEKINPLYFLNSNNRSSIRLTHRFMQDLLSKSQTYGSALSSHIGSYIGDYYSLGNGVPKRDQIERAINLSTLLEQNHIYEIQESSKHRIVYTLAPKDHIDRDYLIQDLLLGDSAWEGIIAGMISSGFGVDYSILESSKNRGGTGCLIQVNL